MASSFNAKDSATLKIAVELDGNGEIRESSEQAAGKISEKSFAGVDSNLTAAQAEEAYAALKTTLGYNAENTNIKMRKIVESDYYDDGE